MKKLTALLLVLVLICSLSVTAFAAGEQSGTTTITAEVPEASYTIHIPADMELEYGNTEKQEIGKVYVTDAIGFKKIIVALPYTDLINTSDSEDTIPLVIYDYYEYDINELPEFIETMEDEEFEILKNGSHKLHNGYTMVYNTSLVGISPEFETAYATQLVYAKVSDWSGATPGATYKAVITFNFSAE